MLKKFILIAALASAKASCPPREDMIQCFYEKADQNGDGIITKHELSKKVFSTLAWYEKVPFNLFGGIGRIMKDCDANQDGQLTVKESLNMQNCMDSCFKRRHTKQKFHC
jgi:Ca2+-binding EF-hand superfamily protein